MGSTLPATGVGCCMGALRWAGAWGQRGRREQGGHLPPARSWDALGQRPVQVRGQGLNPPQGVAQAPGLWLHPTSPFQPQSPFHFHFTLVLPPLHLRPGEVFASGKPSAASVFEQLLYRARYLVFYIYI